MKFLKSYREQNPDKGYWDWKVEAFQIGGITEDDRTDHQVDRPIIPERTERIIYGKKYSELTHKEQFMNRQGYLNGRPLEKGLETVSPEFDIFALTRSVFNAPKLIDKLLRELNTEPDYKKITEYVNKKYFKDFSTFGKEDSKFVHTQLGNKNSVFAGKNKGAYIEDGRLYPGEPLIFDQKPYVWWNKNKPYTDLGVNLDGFTVTVIRPEDASDLTLVRNMNVPVGLWNGKSGFVLPSEYVTNNPVSLKNTELIRFNGLIDTYEKIKHYADGGETGNIDEETKRRINLMLGRSASGRPLERGLQSVLDIEDAANFTPIGDAIAVKDTYNAVKSNDWITTGLAAIGVLPFIPSGLQRISKVKRSIPEVHRNTQDLIDAKVAQLNKAAEDRAKFSNEQYRIVERVMDDPSYLNRATEVKLKFGDDYSIPYADMFLAYNTDPSSLPLVTLIDDLVKAGTMSRTPNGFVYGINPNNTIPNVGEHELSHFTDLLKSGKNNAEAGNNMFYQMSKDLNKKVDSHDKYFSNPSELKAHMNLFREWMFLNGYINTRDQKITPEYMSKILKQLDNIPEMKGVKRASQLFKSNRTYTKWFNLIPLIGTAALGVNTYFTNNNKE